MKKIVLGIGSIILVVGALGFLSIGGTEFNLFMKNKYGVKFADADRKIYENSRSFTQGKKSELAKIKYEYENEKDETSREAMRNLIINRFSDIETSAIDNVDLENFLIEVRGY